LDLEQYFISPKFDNNNSLSTNGNSSLKYENSKVLFFVIAGNYKNTFSSVSPSTNSTFHCDCPILIGCVPFSIVGYDLDHSLCNFGDDLKKVSPQLSDFDCSSPGCRYFPSFSSSSLSNCSSYIILPINICFGERKFVNLLLFRSNEFLSSAQSNIFAINLLQKSRNLKSSLSSSSEQLISLPTVDEDSSSFSTHSHFNLSLIFKDISNSSVLQRGVVGKISRLIIFF
jgi:hypothetical protein